MTERPVIGNSWDALLAEEFQKPYFKALIERISLERKNSEVFPPEDDVFNALKYTPYENVKAVIIGQDPYHEPGQAHGLCFSVKKGVKIPPSLVNIYKEINSELGCRIPDHGNLSSWAEQGVLLLNAVLTVRSGEANSHKGLGWETFTDRVISLVNEKKTPVVFLLWGANAGAKSSLVTNPMHMVLKCAHPSPLSAYNGFFGCGHFAKTNGFLKLSGEKPVDWQIR